jgi:hypothetical protein
MEDFIPIMCAAALSLLYSGEITSMNQLQVAKLQAFPEEVPNNGFLFQDRPEMWEMGIMLKNENITPAAGGLMWFKVLGAPHWHKGQVLTVRISACNDEGMLSTLQGWNAFAPAVR